MLAVADTAASGPRGCLRRRRHGCPPDRDLSLSYPFTYGNVGRTLSDVRAGRYRLQPKADVFNVFNRTQFGAPNGSVTSAAFGTVSTQANSPRD